MTDASSAGPLWAGVHAILAVVGRPVAVSDLAHWLQVAKSEVEDVLPALEDVLEGSGLQLQRLGDRVQLASAPDWAAAVARALQPDSSPRLSPAAYEALAVVAHRQPITRGQVDAVRGVNSDGVMNTLEQRGLIEEVGRATGIGRPRLYATTFRFLELFGMRSLGELPPLPEPGATAVSMETAQWVGVTVA